MKELEHCMICPRYCGVNRNLGEQGYCRVDAGYHIGSICLHTGEEPVVSGKYGICNIFFSHCNLQCLYCQNYQISRNRESLTDRVMDPDNVVDEIVRCIESGADAVGFVTPSHFIPHIKALINMLHKRGYHPVTIYNTNSYDTVESLQSLEGLIDVYLPDLKYADPVLARDYSGASDYPETARKAVTEMFRQKGSTLVIGDNGQAVNGMIIRHLVLPGQANDSIQVLKWIAGTLSPEIHLSLMSQYYPTSCVASHPELSRRITKEEYEKVVQVMEELGFYRGWVQEMDSCHTYRPDFSRPHPFESK